MIISSEFDKPVQLQIGDTAEFSQYSLSIIFEGAGTAAMDNDDVISDASFVIYVSGKKNDFILETVNGRTSFIDINRYRITLDYADGYSQSCGITVSVNS